MMRRRGSVGRFSLLTWLVVNALLTAGLPASRAAAEVTVRPAEESASVEGDLNGTVAVEAAAAAVNPLSIITVAGDGANATVDGTGLAASFRDMGGVAISGGYAYVGTYGSIRRVRLSDNLVETWAGHATATGCTDHSDRTQVRFEAITDIATDGTYLYTAGACGSSTRIRKTSIATGATSPVATVSVARYVTVGPDGNLYVTGGQGVYKVDPSSGTVTTFAWMSGTTYDITADGTYLWMAWSSNSLGNTIERFTLDGNHLAWLSSTRIGFPVLESVGGYLYGSGASYHLRRYNKADPASHHLVAGSGSPGSGDPQYDDGTGTDAWFTSVTGVASNGTDLWMADNRRLRKGTETSPLPSAQPPAATSDLGISVGAVVTTAGNGTNATQDGIGEAASFREMGGVTAANGMVYVGTNGSIRAVDPATKEVSTVAGHPTETSCANSPVRSQVRFTEIIDIESDGHYLYTTSVCGLIYRLRRTSIATGATSTVASDLTMRYLTVGPDGMIYATGGQGLYRIDPIEGTAETFLWYTDGHGRAIASDATYLWVARSTNPTSIERVTISDRSRQTFDTSGSITEEIIGLTAIESAGRYLYALTWLNAIRIYDKATGDMLFSIAGWTGSGYADGQGTQALFDGIYGIASDGEYLWVADRNNYRLRKIGQGYPTGETMGECRVGEDPGSPLIDDEWMFHWCAFQADPLNSVTGSFYHRATDVRLPGIGVPFSFRRTYDSINASTGPLGQGWRHRYQFSLTRQANGDVVVRLADGRRITFTEQDNGSFWGGPGVRAKLAAEGTGYVLTNRSQLAHRFDAQGRLTSVRDRNGQGLTFSYDGSGNLTGITDSAGRQITLSYSGSLLTGLSLPDGRSVGYGYTSGLLTSVTDLRGKVTTYEYDASGRLTRIVDPNGRSDIENTYGADGRVISQRDPLGNQSTFSWDAATQTATMTDARGKVWRDVYSDGKLVRRENPLGNATRYRYAGAHLRSVTDPRGNKTTMTYDGRGNLLTRTAPAPLSYQESFAYNARNDLTGYTDARGNTTTYEYDGAGNVIKVTQPGTVITQFDRDPAGTGLLTSITDPRGKVTRFEYDAQGNLTKVTTPLGNVTTMGYDPSGRMTSLVEPRGNVAGANPGDYRWTYTYDEASNLRTRTDPLGNRAEWIYDPAGNLSAVVDPKDRRTTYGYNNADELSSVTAPDLTVTSYAYDQSGNLISRTDPKAHTTTYGYDPARRLTSVLSPTGQLWTYEYDPAGNLTTVTTARGNATPDPADGTIAYSYDVLNRLTGIDYSDATPDVTFAYDANGNRTQMTDGAGTETYRHDALNRLTQVTRGSDSFSYAYDPADNVTRRTYPDSTVVDYTYDDDGRLATVSSGGVTTSYGYDPAGNLLTTTLPSGNGHVESRFYDRAGRLTEVKNANGSSVLSQFTYTLDPVGNPTQVVTPAGTTTYQYDPLDRLTEVCFQASCPGPSDPYIRWAYDPVGNRTTETRPSGTTTYTYNDADQLLSAAGPSGTTTYGYDADGNQTQAGSRTFAYDLANRLASTTSGSSTITYSYDGDGKRLLASAGSQASQKTKYLWDANWALYQLALERDGNDALLRRYVHGADLISMTSGNSPYYYHYDALGSTANLTSKTGTAQWSYTYEPFGTIRTQTKHATKAPTNLMRFTGELIDEATALYHLRARQYDPATGRFLATDPLPPPTALAHSSSYAYVSNQPTVGVDPSGLRMSFATMDKEGCPSWGRFFTIGEWENVYCEGFLTMDPTWQGIWGATIQAAPPALLAALIGRGCIARPSFCTGLLKRPHGLRARIAMHPAHHAFRLIGPQRHIQITIYIKAVKQSGFNIHIPIP